MAFDIISTLDLDKELLGNRLILINESSGCEANFFMSCLIAKQIKDSGAVCLVTVHNDSNHYHTVGLKLGYNLNHLRGSGSVIDIDFMESVVNGQRSLDDLFERIQRDVLSLSEKYPSVSIVLDDVTHFLHLNHTTNDVVRFIYKCRNLMRTDVKFSLIIGAHVIGLNDDSHTISQLTAHMSDLIVDVSSLKTGRSTDVSGSFKILRPWCDDTTDSNKLTKLDNYLYKLFDRGVKVFAHGHR